MSTISEALSELNKLDKENSILVESFELLEGKLDDIYDKYYAPKGMEKADFETIVQLDPTSAEDKMGKYTQWLLNKFKKGEDIIKLGSRLTKALNEYNKNKNKFTDVLGTGDINTLASVEDFVKAIESTTQTPYARGLAQRDDVQLIASSDFYDVYHPLNKDGNAAIVGLRPDGSHDLNWCTGYAGDSYYNNYGGNYYCFIYRDDPTDKTKCFQINIRNGDVQYFLNGSDEHVYNGGDNDKERFFIFLVSNPDLLVSLQGTQLEDQCETVRRAIQKSKDLSASSFKYTGEFVLKDIEKVEKALIKTVEIEEGVTSIKPGAFIGCASLEEVTFSSTVEIVGVRAFCDCPNLKVIKFNEGLKDIRAFAFADDLSLKRVDIPDSVESLDVTAFKDCPDVILRVRAYPNRYLNVRGLANRELDDKDLRWIRKHFRQVKE